MKFIRCFMRNNSGVTLVEYGVVAAIIALVVMMSMSTGTS
jgi:Flp pilus assembly pilin Flp